jgi:hypothetical protein
MGLVGRGFRPHRAFVIIPVSLTPNSLFARAGPRTPKLRTECQEGSVFPQPVKLPRTRGEKSGLKISATAARQEPAPLEKPQRLPNSLP